MSKFIDKLSSNKIFMATVMVYDIIFNIILMTIYFIGLPTNGSVSNSAFGFEMNIASHIVLAIAHLLFLVFGIYIFIKLLGRYKNKTNINLQSLVFKDINKNWLNVCIISITFLWQIIYNLIMAYLAFAPAIANIIYSPQYGMQINFVVVIVNFIIALVTFIFVILNIIYYTFLLKKQGHQHRHFRKYVLT